MVENCTLDATSSIQFSSLISAVDPVAVLAIFEEIGVNMGLYFLGGDSIEKFWLEFRLEKRLEIPFLF